MGRLLARHNEEGLAFVFWRFRGDDAGVDATHAHYRTTTGTVQYQTPWRKRKPQPPRSLSAKDEEESRRRGREIARTETTP